MGMRLISDHRRVRQQTLVYPATRNWEEISSSALKEGFI